MLRPLLAAALPLIVAACATTPDGMRPPGEHGCESFFIYAICVADRDRDGAVDYMYFDDSRDIFMYFEPVRSSFEGDLPFHPCAIPFSDLTREYASQLLYGEDLSLTERLGVKGRLIMQYRAAQPGVDACNTALKSNEPGSESREAPFLADEDWDEGA